MTWALHQEMVWSPRHGSCNSGVFLNSKGKFMLPRQEDKIKQITQVVPVSSTKQIRMYFTTFWSIGLWSTFFNNEENNKNAFILVVCIALLIELFNKNRLFNFRSQSLIKEIKKSHAPDYHSLSHEGYATEEKPFEYTSRHYYQTVGYPFQDNVFQYDLHQLTWTIGEGRIEKHLRSIFRLFDKINEQRGQALKKPSEFRRYRKFLPYVTLNTDMPSKTRLLEFSAVPGYYAGSSIATLLNLTSTPRSIFIVSYATLSWGLNFLDSYDWADIIYKYKLEGFSYYYKSWASFPPTCIGTQLTKKLEFNPSNSLLIKSITYIIDAETILQNFKNNPTFLQTLDHETTRSIESFQHLSLKIRRP
jgi:hypothetical protein